MALSAKHERFCLEYVKDCNATAAYRRTGYAAKDADVAGPALLGKIGITARIAVLQQRVAAKLEISAEGILARLNALAMNRDPDGEKVRHFDQITAAGLVGKHLKLFTERLEVSGQLDIAAVIAERRAELNKKRNEEK